MASALEGISSVASTDSSFLPPQKIAHFSRRTWSENFDAESPSCPRPQNMDHTYQSSSFESRKFQAENKSPVQNGQGNHRIFRHMSISSFQCMFLGPCGHASHAKHINPSVSPLPQLKLKKKKSSKGQGEVIRKHKSFQEVSTRFRDKANIMQEIERRGGSSSQLPTRTPTSEKWKTRRNTKSDNLPCSQIFKASSQKKDIEIEKLDSLNRKAKHTKFQLAELQVATSNFNRKFLLGEGGFGKVYRGILPVDRKEVAVKVLKQREVQGNIEFVTELELLSRLAHRNLVKLYGFCCTSGQSMLVYEYLPNGSLHDHLHGRIKSEVGPLSWEKRVRMAAGAAHGLKFLHSHRPQILHRDIKAANILITNNFTAKVADFGCAKLIGGCFERQGVGRRIVEFVDIGVGTAGLIAPEMLMAGEISSATDVFSFGVVLLEILSGREPIEKNRSTCSGSLVSWALPLLNKKKWGDLVDPNLINSQEFDQQTTGSSFIKVAKLAQLCLSFDPTLRPSFEEISKTLSILDCGDTDSQGSGESLEFLPSLGSTASSSELQRSQSVSLSVSCGTEGSIRLSKYTSNDIFTLLQSTDDQVRNIQNLMSLIEDGQELEWSGGLKICKYLK